MALPSGFLDELRNRLSLSDVVGRKVTWDQRKSQPAKGDFWAPCPFHQEKTPSFHVEDRKGFYYCFGCHEKGDMITFVQQIENVSFIEAVEILAREAGMEMPQQTRDPQAREKRDRQTRLIDAMEQAVQLFGLAFRSGQGQTARDYAARRGLSPETLKRFQIGYAPDSRSHLTQHFREKGLLDEAIGAGLVIQPEGGGTPYDRFRGRLMFPIRDPRGRAIAFGGRALGAEQSAKYLNSPETDIFHKGRVLFNHAPAGDAARNAGTVIVTEGYMDVIALAQAGFDHAVAPLGTAVTEDQLNLLWRMAPEPIIALDGDKAGIRAAHRVIDLALPLLAPGRSLRFCMMPEGQDPDDLIKSGGRQAMEEVLANASPLIDMLWRREAELEPIDTPERRAAFDARLREAIRRIGDAGVRNHYAADLRQRREELFAGMRPQRNTAQGQRGAWQRGKRGAAQGSRQGPLQSTRNSALVTSQGESDAARMREAAILLIAYHNRTALGELEQRIEEMPLATEAFAPLRDLILDAVQDGAELPPDTLAPLTHIPQARAHPQARPGQDPVHLGLVLTEAIDRHEAHMTWLAERAEAERDFAEAEGEDWTWRQRQAFAEMRRVDQRAAQSESDEKSDNKASALQRMLDEGAYKRKKKGQRPTNQ